MITDIALEHNDTELTLVSQIIELLRLLDTLSDPEIKDTSKTKDFERQACRFGKKGRSFPI